MPHTVDTRGLGGRVAIVTGAARGIGRAICVELAHAGCSVVAADVVEPDDTVAAVTASGARGHAILADEPGSVRAYRAGRTISPKIGHDTVQHSSALLLHSITSVTATAAGRVVVTGSHGGRVAAATALRAGVAAAIFNDASVGKDRAGVSGLELLEAAATPGAAVEYRSANVGDAADTLERGVLSFVNATAKRRGWRPGLRVVEAVELAAGWPRPRVDELPADEIEGRYLLAGGPVEIWALDSASAVRDADAGAILATGSHGGLVGRRPEAALRVNARAALFNDAGGGAGTARLGVLEARGVAAATVSAESARIGDGRSTYADGILSAVNAVAMALGARPGLAASAFAELVLASAGGAR